VPPGHPAPLVRELVRRELDLAAILADYGEARGQPPYHPAMMVALLLYACTRASTRRGGSPGHARSAST
jgi:transposase